MKKALVLGRNWIIGNSYRFLLKPIFFLFDPEDVHNRLIATGRLLGKYTLTRLMTRLMFSYSHPALEQEILGIKFRNPVGLAAGFDKDADVIDIIPAVGFGFEEIGSVTGEPCYGNPRPRLWRLPKSRSLIVWFGLKSSGSEVISQRLLKKKLSSPLGISVAMTNCSANLEVDSAIADYAKAFGAFANFGSYLTINVSCPNTTGGQPFSEPPYLDRLLTRLDQIATDRSILLKLSPDLSGEDLDKVIDISRQHRVHGFICSNLTKNRDSSLIVDPLVTDKGGFSGKVSRPQALMQIKQVYRRVGKEMLVVGCGGIFNAHDAYEMIRSGASLVQLITGMIFEGPQVVSEINLGLVELLRRDGFSSIKEAVGVDNLAI